MPAGHFAPNFDSDQLMSLLEKGYNKQQCANALGVSRTAIYMRLYRLGLDPIYHKRIKALQKGWFQDKDHSDLCLTKGNPVRCREAIIPSEVKRHIWCIRYDKCLDYAAKKRWNGFTCRECKEVEEQIPTSLDFLRKDAGNCSLLLNRTCGAY